MVVCSQLQHGDEYEMPGKGYAKLETGGIFDVNCPFCGHAAGFFKDEATRECRFCKHTVKNPSE